VNGQRVLDARRVLERAQGELDAVIERLFSRGRRSEVTFEDFDAAVAARDRAKREPRAALRAMGKKAT